MKQYRLRMPRVSAERTRSGVVAGNCENVGTFFQDDRKCGIKMLDRFFLSVEASILSMHVGVFVMNEEKIILIVEVQVLFELLLDGLRPFNFFHADKLRQALVHWVN